MKIENVGFDLEYVDGVLKSKEAVIPEPEYRYLHDMKKVLKDPNYGNDSKVYAMYRDVHIPGDEKIFRKYRQRFDITVMPAGKIGHEYVKTHGHFHSCVEIYEVVHGEGIFLLHKKSGFYPIKCPAGYRTEIPRNAWHVTSNQSKDVLIMVNLMPDKMDSNYKLIEKTQGEAYYLVAKDKFVKNNRFKLPVRRAKPTKSHMPLYNEFISKPKTFTYMREK